MNIKHQIILLNLLFILCLSCNDDEPIDVNLGTGTEEILPENKLPRVEINTNGAEIVDEPKIVAQMHIKVNEVTNYEGSIGIEIRGSSSQLFPKKQFGFETRDDQNEDLDVSLLGFPEEEDWILYAPYSDKTLFRNVLIYDLSRDIGRYASRVQFVDLYINDSYNGVYVLMEKLKRDNNRININNLKEDENNGEDLTGGYIIKIDKADGGGTDYTSVNSFTSSYAPNYSSGGQQIHFLYDNPDEEDITAAQRTYIQDYMTNFENALAGNNFTDIENGYNAYIDAQSFIDFFLLNELANNVDGYRLSTWLVKDKNKKLQMGPIWDFNLAFGNADYCGAGSTSGWAYKFNERCSDDFWQIPFWWDRLLEDAAFVAQLQSRWQELRSTVFSNSALDKKIDTYVETLNLSGAAVDNFQKWDVLGQYVWPNNFVGNSYNAELGYLTDWLFTRINWLDSAIMNL